MSDTKDTSRANSFVDEKSGGSETEFIHDELKRLDIGLALLKGHTEDAAISPEESKRLRRKIDWHLLPLLCLIYTGLYHYPTSTAIILITINTVQFIDK